MSLSFPTNPVLNQQSTQNGRVYTWTGSAWEISANFAMVPSISGSSYIEVNAVNNNYVISATGLQPSGNYSVMGHTHSSSDITNFNSSVSGLLPVKDIVAGSGVTISTNSGIYTINSSGTGGASITIANYANNRILTSDGTVGGIVAESGLVFDTSSTLLALDGYMTINNGLSAPTPIFSLGIGSGNVAISYDTDKQIQSVTLNGSNVNFTRGAGFNINNRSMDIVLQITVSSNTTVLWDIVDNWYNQPPLFSANTKHIVLLRSMGSAIHGYYIGQSLTCNIGDSWYPVATGLSFVGVASSSDGRKLVATVGSTGSSGGSNGRIYTSSDGGLSWIARDSVRDWMLVCSSSDGTKLAATVYGGQIYISNDSGVTWTPKESNRNWWGITMTPDGSKIAAVVTGGQIYISSDVGNNTWTPTATNRNWKGIAMSSNGLKLVATTTGDTLYLSTDGGSNWTSRQSVRNWGGVSCNSSGTLWAACATSGNIFVSTSGDATNGGTTWFARDTIRNWNGVKVFDSGNIVATTNPGQIFISIDGQGLTWTPSDIARNWGAIDGSSDNTQLVATVQNQAIYLSRCGYEF